MVQTYLLCWTDGVDFVQITFRCINSGNNNAPSVYSTLFLDIIIMCIVQCISNVCMLRLWSSISKCVCVCFCAIQSTLNSNGSCSITKTHISRPVCGASCGCANTPNVRCLRWACDTGWGDTGLERNKPPVYDKMMTVDVSWCIDVFTMTFYYAVENDRNSRGKLLTKRPFAKNRLTGDKTNRHPDLRDSTTHSRDIFTIKLLSVDLVNTK